jgi:predicted site-specific integrase-resolvase
MQTAAIYARVSSERQKEGHTVESQIEGLLDYARRGIQYPMSGSLLMKVSVVATLYGPL